VGTFPPNPFDTGIDRVLITIAVLLFWWYAVLVLVRLLRRSRPGLRIGGPITFAYAIRVLAIAGVTATGIGSSLRGGDEVTFLDRAHALAGSSFGSRGWLPYGHYGLHEILFALQLRLGEFTIDTMRIAQVGFAVLGIVFIATSVYDLGGTRASRVSAWLLALEPAGIFFSQVLHKEPLMMLATGLVVFGGTKVWKRLDLTGFVAIGIGGAIAVATRSYAGWFLISAAVFLTMHAAVRNLRHGARAALMLLGVAGVIAIAVPVALEKTSKQNLQALQVSQTANAQAAGTSGNNLALEQVDFSSRSAIITHLPQRISDLLLRPYPWQVQDSSQQVGVLGTLVAYAAIVLLGVYAVRLRGRVFDVAAPLLYPFFFLLLAYSLSVGNAGTGFRYRSHLIQLVIPAIVLLREYWLAEGLSRRTGAVSSRLEWRLSRDAPLGIGGAEAAPR
jgi:hypothetical protein